MKTNRTKSNIVKMSKAGTIKTSLMEILQALTSETKDDSLIVESLGNIFTAYRVRFGRTLAPVRITNGKPALSLRRGNLGRRSAAWA